MPAYQFDKFLAVKMKSQSKPLSGQSNRSSDNYDLRELKKGSKLFWRCPNNMAFNVMEDRSLATDPTVFSFVTNGATTDFPSESAASGLYIAKPMIRSGFPVTEDFTFEIVVTVVP